MVGVGMAVGAGGAGRDFAEPLMENGFGIEVGT